MRVFQLSVYIVANWIYDKLKDRKIVKLRIDNQEIQVSKEEILRAAKEKIEKE